MKKNNPLDSAAFLIAFAALIVFLLSGCSALDHHLLNATQTVTPAVTNYYPVTYTNAAGNVATNIVPVVLPAVTNITYTPAPMAQTGAQLISALPFPGAGTAGIALGWALTAYAAIRSRKLSTALVSGIEAGRKILQTTPEGQALDHKFKDALIEHQEIAGVLNAASGLVNSLTGDTVQSPLGSK